METKTDWRVGSGMEVKGEWQGKPYAAKGVIVAFDRPRLLKHTHWSALSGLPDQPQNYQTVTYRLTPREGGTELTLREENLPGDEKKKLSEQTWRKVLGALRELVEK